MCQEGFVGVFQPAPKPVCVSSLYHINGSLTANTLYIKNCVEYSLLPQNLLVCRTCDVGFVISQDQKSCFSNTGLANCVRASNQDNLCNVCENGYVMVNRQCVKGAIDNCLIYAQYTGECRFCSYYEQVCVQCQKEYYLEGNTCIQGLIKNCSIQHTAKICQQCEDNFTLILSKNGTSYCYPNDPRYNCKVFSADLL